MAGYFFALRWRSIDALVIVMSLGIIVVGIWIAY
jgi:hypothetical protein